MSTSGDSQQVIRGLLGALPLASVSKRPSYHWFVVGTVCIGAFMAALDASIVNIALPKLRSNFHVGMNVIEWVSLVYLLTLAGLIVPFGRMADMFGRRWMYACGFLIFIMGSFLCGISGNLVVLLSARVIQAVGAAMLQSNSVSIITATTPTKALGKAIGIQASAQGIGLSLGPTIGGALLSYLSWNWIFLINIPVGIVGTILGILLLPRDNFRGVREKFDFLGGLLLLPSLVALIFMLNMGTSHGWGAPWIVASYVAFSVCLPLFLYVESKTRHAMVDLRLFRSRVFSLGNLAGILSFTVMYAALLLSPFYMDEVQKFSPLTSGLFLTIVPVGMTLFTPLSGFLADSFGPRMPTTVGMLVAVAGCVALALVGGHLSITFLVIGLFLVGSGTGLFTPPNNSSIMASVQQNRLGIAGGILNMSRTVGMSLGVTLGGMAYEWFLQINTHPHARDSLSAIRLSFREAFICVSVIALIGLILTNFGTQTKVMEDSESESRT